MGASLLALAKSIYEISITLLKKVSKAIDDKEYTTGMFLDLWKAFDTVKYGILLYKLKHFGISGVVLVCFQVFPRLC